MPGKSRPSFLKRQKEQKRVERATEKREARRLKKRGKAALGEVEPDDRPDPGEGSLSGEPDALEDR